jgi:hypothetical protein
MATKKTDPTTALVTVISALESLQDEKDRQWVLQSAASKFNVTLQTPNAGGAGGNGGSSGAGVAADIQAAIAKKDPRAFIRIKRPVTDVQRVACLGYYLVHTTGQPGFTSKDVATAHTDSGGSRINLPRALDNATRRSKYISVRSGREKQLTTLGEDVVNALPDQDAVATIEAEVNTGRRKKRKKAKKA